MPSSSSLHRTSAVSAPGISSRSALLDKGFRPFFLLAAAFSAVAVPVWLLLFAGLASSTPYFTPLFWHAHEMLFGFTLAVLAGFLLTAAGNWTGRETLTGAALGGLAALWLLGRVLMFVPQPQGAVRAVIVLVDLAFAPLVALSVARPIIAAQKWKNLGFVLILVGFSIANLWMHLGAQGVVPSGLFLGARFALNLTLLAIVIITARILPMFTRNATGISSVRSLPMLDKASIALVLLVTIADLWGATGWFAAALAGAAGGAVLLRARHWSGARTTSYPLLWVLHLGHLWIGVGLLLKAASALGSSMAATWVHALTVGGIGLLTLGMMVRVTLGHTGRMLASPRSATLGFVALSVSALVRVFGPVAVPGQQLLLLAVAGALWSLAFVLFLMACAPMLLKPRVDGRPG